MSKCLDENGQEYKKSGSGGLFLVGTIVPIHPEVESAYLPDSSKWKICDGVADLPSEHFNHTNDTKVPDLTDDRFLQGGSAYGTGGGNSYTPVFSASSHTHSAWTSLYYVSGWYWMMYRSGGNSGRMWAYVASGNAQATGSGGGVAYAQGTSANTWQSASSTGSVTGTAVSDSRPKYFSAKYYIKVAE
jgi:hypothetical protein